VPAPSERDQVAFLTKIQRLLDESRTQASYKFALLLALADIAIEHGDDSGAPLHVPLTSIAEKWIAYYWPQARPHPAGPVLHQNIGKQAAIIGIVAGARAESDGSLAALKRDRRRWTRLCGRVAGLIEDMPLLKLQRMADRTIDDFLYANVVVGQGVELRAGIAYCLRKFHGLIQDLVRGAWIRYVRGVKDNQSVLGEKTDLGEFLFGSERAALSIYAPVLRRFQEGRCFYCDLPLNGRKEAVDHFVPWSRYPVDLGHNFVLVDERCNGSKSDSLAAPSHLAKWWRRNAERESELKRAFDDAAIVHDIDASKRVALWAYDNAAQAGAHVWVQGKTYEALAANWRSITGSRDGWLFADVVDARPAHASERSVGGRGDTLDS
jgi:hypothetical protein